MIDTYLAIISTISLFTTLLCCSLLVYHIINENHFIVKTRGDAFIILGYSIVPLTNILMLFDLLHGICEMHKCKADIYKWLDESIVSDLENVEIITSEKLTSEEKIEDEIEKNKIISKVRI